MLINMIAYGNALSGKIPDQIGFLFATLRYLDLSFNHLTGEMPMGVSRLVKVETMYLNHNNLNGMIPKGINKMISLKHMRLEENEFTNTVKNVGPIEVYSDQTHIDLTEQWTERWNIGPHYPQDIEYLRWKKGREAEKAAVEAKWVKGHIDRLAAAKKTNDDMIKATTMPPPKTGKPMPDAKKDNPALDPRTPMNKAMEAHILPTQIGEVPSLDGHTL